MSNLIIIPFAYKQGASTGVNIKRQSASLDIYLKNCCVALISAMKNSGPDTDCALVTNIQIPNKYAEILVNNEPTKSNYKLRSNDRIEVRIPLDKPYEITPVNLYAI